MTGNKLILVVSTRQAYLKAREEGKPTVGHCWYLDAMEKRSLGALDNVRGVSATFQRTAKGRDPIMIVLPPWDGLNLWSPDLIHSEGAEEYEVVGRLPNITIPKLIQHNGFVGYIRGGVIIQ